MNKKTGGVNIGTSLILVIFVVMCFVTFAVLSYVSAVSDRDLSIQAKDRTLSYYKASNKAEERMKLYEENESAAAEFTSIKDGKKIIAFTEECDENHYLQVVAYKDEESGKYIVTEWTSNVNY